MTFEQAKISALEWKITVMWFILFTVNSLGTCILAASAGCVWDNLGWQEKLTVVLAVIVNWTGTMMAWLSKSAGKITSGQNPIIDLQNSPETPTLPQTPQKP